MSSYSGLVFGYRVWQRSEPIKQLHPPDEIPIEFRISKVRGVDTFFGEVHEDDDPAYSSLERFLIPSTTVWVAEHEALLGDGGGLRSTLLTMGVAPEHLDRVSSDISKVAHLRMVARSLRSSIVVDIVHAEAVMVQEVDDDEDHDESDTVEHDDEDNNYESDSDCPMDTLAATKSSIEALEKVILEEGMGENCMICMEGYEGGMEVTRTPSSHIFHGDCIVKWFQTSHLCPLCRHPRPSSD
ncbi:hypothetical protein I3760_12G018000 [Carya illinoinensis]|nr:hypothetical protein I3760_12G018000 [Carya illinoinensis]